MQPIIKMRKLAYFLFILLTIGQTTAQIHEIGVFAGGSNFIGDVGKTTYIAPDSPAFGVIYKWNKSKRHAWRFGIMTSKLKGDDRLSELKSRRERGFRFENRITELSAGLEFNFFNFDLHQNTFALTPYIHTGINYFKYDNLYFITNQPNSRESSWSFAIPMTVGIKTKLTPSVILALESSVRYTFVDDLDGSLPQKDYLKPYTFGNPNSKDWYAFTGISLTYTFGENPCYCKE